MSRRSSSSDGGDYGGDLFAADYDDDYDIPSVAPQSVGPQAVEEPEEEEEVRRTGLIITRFFFFLLSDFTSISPSLSQFFHSKGEECLLDAIFFFFLKPS